MSEDSQNISIQKKSSDSSDSDASLDEVEPTDTSSQSSVDKPVKKRRDSSRFARSKY